MSGRGELSSQVGPAIDLSNCESEPIHVPGSIQPHGALLVLEEPGNVIRHASDNTRDILGLDPEALLGGRLEEILAGEGRGAVLAALRGQDLKQINPLAVELATPGGGRLRLDGIAHRHDGLLILELERLTDEGQGPGRDSDRLVRFAIAQLQGELRLADFCKAAAREVRTLTEYDRVMIYRFDEEWNGEVIAEDRAPELEPFLGLRYPSSDIPAQARRLYTLNWVRHIADARYRPARIVPERDPRNGRPIDLSFAALRSVSPMHVEYLRNMGVSSSLSISILKEGKLWGLIACHHYRPRPLPYRLRAACEFLGLIMSLQLSTKIDDEEAACRARARAIHATMLNRLTGSRDLVEALLIRRADLLDLVGAAGAAILHDGRCTTVGEAPCPEQIARIAGWLRENPAEVFQTDSLAAVLPEAAESKDSASGLLAISFPHRGRGDQVLWFRPEVVRTVRWGGNPEKRYEVGPNGPRLTPRGSFDTWVETQRLRSAPWGDCAIEAARALREGLIAAALRRAGELEEADRRKDEFIAVLAHELRNPLAAISNAIELAKRSTRPEHLDRAKGVIEHQVRHFSRLIDDLLDVSRVVRGKVSLQREALDISGPMARAAEVARPLIEERRHHFRLANAPGRLLVDADPTRLEQILANLLTNAAKYTEEGGRIEMTSSRERDSVVIRVKDDGVGIAPEMIPRVFDLFAQVDRSIDLSRGGLGIGLTLVRRLVEMHGGAVTVSSDGPGRGSEFSVQLPLLHAEATNARRPEAPAPAAEVGRSRILIVDDSVDSSNSLATILELAGHEAWAVHDGPSAIAAAMERRPDVILLDISLPGMDGYQVAEALRRLPSFTETLIIAISGYGQEEARCRSQEAGIDFHLVKPVDIETLFATIAVRETGHAAPRSP